jgi:cephalosporin hydroxylase
MRKILLVAVLCLALGALFLVGLLSSGMLDSLVAGRVRTALARGEAARLLPPSLAGLADEEARTRFAIARVKSLAQNDWLEWNNDWMGVTLQQYPSDIMTYQRLVTELRPDVIVETGTFHGASALFFAQLLEHLRPDGRVITVDIDSSHWDATVAARGEELKPLFERIEFVHASSTAPETLEKIRARTAGKTVMVMLDSLHFKDHVAAELKLYAPLVTKGSYLIVNDTHLDGTDWIEDKPGPRAALTEFLAQSKDFEVDASRNRYRLTCTEGGFLKRVR